MTNKFLIQTINGEIHHDFSFHLLKAIEYHNWFRNESVYEKIVDDSPDIPNCIPVGSLEFVFSYLKIHHSIQRESIHPINIPSELFKLPYLKRNCSVLDKNQLVLTKPTFLKSATKYKSFVDVVPDAKHIPEDRYFVSETIDIDSEWRVFVFNRELVGVHHYLGSFDDYPDIPLIKNMINDFKNAPPSYTLDVGTNGDGTFLIEVHPFVSCGLYGFQNYKLLPSMFSRLFITSCGIIIKRMINSIDLDCSETCSKTLKKV